MACPLGLFHLCSFIFADPNLSMMFVGEEILHSARVWTHGYDIFAPDENLVSALTALATSWCWFS